MGEFREGLAVGERDCCRVVMVVYNSLGSILNECDDADVSHVFYLPELDGENLHV